MGPAGRGRRFARRHDRRDRQRPRAVGPGFEAAAVQLRGIWHRRARDIVAAVARALPQRPSRPARIDTPADLQSGPDCRSASRAAGGGSTRRSAAVRSRCAPANLHRRIPLEIKERAVRWPPRAWAGAAHDRRWPHNLPGGGLSGLPARGRDPRLFAGLDPVRVVAHPVCRPRRHPSNRLGEYRRYECLADRRQRPGGAYVVPRPRERRCGRDHREGLGRRGVAGRRRLCASRPYVSDRLGFGGGKGVATALGVFIPLAWPVAVIAALLWLATAFLSHYSSLAALVAAVASAGLAPLLVDKATALVVAAIALLIILRHHSNIRRLIAGTESRISLKKV